MIDLLDVSAAQGHIDWPRVAAAQVAPGIDRHFRGALAKVTEGPRARDPRRLVNLAGALAVGLRVGVYHYIYPDDELRSAAAADAVAQRIWDAIGDQLPHFRIAIDLEGAAAHLTAQQLLDRVLWLRDAIIRRFGRSPMLYTYLDFYLRRLRAAFAACAELGATVPLWWAGYPGHFPRDGEWPRAIAPWSEVTLWQYSGNVGLRVDGVPGAVDRDLLRGDEDAFREFCGLGPEHADDPPAIVHASPYDDDPPPTAA